MVEPLSGHLHLRTQLMSRLVSFHKGLINSHKFTIRFLARLAERDLRTVLGNTLDYLVKQCNLSDINDLSANIVKKRLTFESVPHGSEWQVSLAQELLCIRRCELVVQGLSQDEIESMLSLACTS